MSPETHLRSHKGFRHFFFRGLAIVLPTALTIWLLVIAFTFVRDNIARPINHGLQTVILHTSSWPPVENADYDEVFETLSASRKQEWAKLNESVRGSEVVRQEARREWMRADPLMTAAARRAAIDRWWTAHWYLDLFGVAIAIVLIYFLGVLLTSYFGRRLYQRGEELVNRVPLLRRVYPSIKQVTDFFFPADATPRQFSRVVAVQYPRKGLWSVGLVTGTTMRNIENQAGVPCMTVFVPSSPTPFTGYVITVPKSDTIDLPVTIEDAIKFTVSGGVVVPPNQMIEADPADLPPSLTDPRMDAPPGDPPTWK